VRTSILRRVLTVHFHLIQYTSFRVRDATTETNLARALSRPDERWARPSALEQGEVVHLAGSID
jgi:hypothetical protein